MEHNQDKPISEIIIAKDFEVVAIPLTKKRLYKADDVDRFLTDVSQSVEVLENAAKEVLERYEKLQKGRVAETDPDIGNITIEMNESEVMQKLRAKEKQIERTKNHMSELLTSAEKRADEIVQEAEITIGVNHRGIERIMEGLPVEKANALTEKICGICSNSHIWNSCRTAEIGWDIEIPERAVYIRVIMGEL